MRKVILAAVAAIALAGGAAFADGPSGSSEHSPTGGYTNDVRCGQGTATPVAVLYAGANGAEVCNEGGPVPVQGRVIVSIEGQYIAADGDKDNEAPADGWARIDSNGVRCGDTGGNLDATHPTSVDGSDDCG